MNRAILEACLPSMLALCGGFLLLWAVLRFSSARAQFSRLWSLHRCQRGSVQSLSFVLTLPVFMLIMLFIIQVSQLMIGIMGVHYAAYAGARAACVWIPAEVSYYEPQNVLNLTGASPAPQFNNGVITVLSAPESQKLQRVQMAVVMACAPICPSRDLLKSGQTMSAPWLQQAWQTSTQLFQSIAPGTSSNPRIGPRLMNKLAYAYDNTAIAVEWRESGSPDRDVNRVSYNPRGNMFHEWTINEVGWEDAITVRVRHDFALLSSAGKFLAARLVPASGQPDRISPQIKRDPSRYRETVYSIAIDASATMTNEGFKSLVPHVETP